MSYAERGPIQVLVPALLRAIPFALSGARRVTMGLGAEGLRRMHPSASLCPGLFLVNFIRHSFSSDREYFEY